MPAELECDVALFAIQDVEGVVVDIRHRGLSRDPAIVIGSSPGTKATANASGHAHQMGVVEILLGPCEPPPPDAKPSGIVSQPEIGVQHDSIQAIVRSVEKLLVGTVDPSSGPYHGRPTLADLSGDLMFEGRIS